MPKTTMSNIYPRSPALALLFIFICAPSTSPWHPAEGSLFVAGDNPQSRLAAHARVEAFECELPLGRKLFHAIRLA